MKVKGLDGREYNLKLKDLKRAKCSSGHEEARGLLKDIFSSYIIYEEVTLPGSKGKIETHPLYADFLIPNIKILVEVHGLQHYTYSAHFHKDKLDFIRAKKRDENKREWCKINNFSYIELKDDERDKWREQIINGI